MSYITVFDALQVDQTWLYILPIGITIAAFLFFRFIRLGMKQALNVDRALPYLVALLFITVVMLFSTIEASDYYIALWAFREHRYQVVEGRVSQFSSIPDGGHGAGHFLIDRTEFFNSNDRLDYFLKRPYQAQDHFQDQTWARVSYYTDRFGKKIIIKVEVRPRAGTAIGPPWAVPTGIATQRG